MKQSGPHAPGLLLACALAMGSFAPLTACGGSAPKPAEGPSEATEPPAAPDEEPASEAPGEAAEESPATASEETTAPPPVPEARDIVYRMTPAGLVIEVEGMEFKPRAKPSRRGRGWAIDLDVTAAAKDERMHRLLDPKNGPLMIAARVTKNGEAEQHEDEREGDDEIVVMAGEPVPLKRSFPTDPKASFSKGSDVLLQIGLWGLAAEGGERRAVRKLFKVKMTVDAGTPQPVITPPQE